jgi:nitroimidazol reductase NimA-like FMN-containing flavoprotein (pyridoxamine 5'-phosphate oxidase superfamily)
MISGNIVLYRGKGGLKVAADHTEIRKYIRELLRKQRLMVLASTGPEYPYCNLVGFAFTEDLKYFIFITGRDSRKYRNIKANSRVSLLLDNRRNSVEDFREAAAVSVFGEAEEVEGKELEALQELYLKRHPHLREFLFSPYTALFRVRAIKYILVRRFQEVVELDME